MEVLTKLSIPYFREAELEELSSAKFYFRAIDLETDRRINKVSRKKHVIADIVDLLLEHFNLGDLKIKFDNNDLDEDCIYIENLDASFEDVVETILKECLNKYFNNIDNINNIDKDFYKLIKLALLNNDQEILTGISNAVIVELFKNSDIEYSLEGIKLDKSRLVNLMTTNDIRNKNMLKICMKYELTDDLMPGQIRAVFACLSSDVFNRASIKTKVHLMNLVYNYFSYHNDDKYFKYRKHVNADFTNVDALNLVLEDLSYKDKNNHLNKIRNDKLLEDVKTGFKYIIKNETDKSNVKRLDQVSIQNRYIK